MKRFLRFLTLCQILLIGISLFSLPASAAACTHDFKEATCITPQTCSLCGVTKGDALGHNWQSATCTRPKTCHNCRLTEGDALGHQWDRPRATLLEPQTCTVCNKKIYISFIWILLLISAAICLCYLIFISIYMVYGHLKTKRT